MKYIGLDLGTNMGVAVIDTANPEHTYATYITLRERGRDLVTTHGQIYRRHRAYISNLLTLTQDIAMVCYEHVMFHTSVLSAHMYGAYEGILLEACHARGVQCVGYNVTTIKKYATGVGRASKDAMVAAAERRWPKVHIPTHDAADAIWVADYGVQCNARA